MSLGKNAYLVIFRRETAYWESLMLASPLTDFTQGTRLLQLTTPLGENRLLAECVRGEEGLSQGFAFQIAALSTDAAISLRTLIGQPALLQLLTAASTDDWRPFHGHALFDADSDDERHFLIVCTVH